VRVAGSLAQILIVYLSGLSEGVKGFLHPSRKTLGPTQPPVQRILDLFPGDKAAGAWDQPTTPSSVEVKEGVEL
jgi:hypothetical protein